MNREEYLALLRRAYQQLPPVVLNRVRWQPPEPEIIIQGNRTVIVNFKEICDKLRRSPEHLSKYFSKVLASPVMVLGNRLIIQGKKFPDDIKKKYEFYIKYYVICPLCGSPDTVLEREGRVWMLCCEACGARTPVKEF
ncbi:MAG: translation initiation factor IF-2 subunit beta [bacterium]|nr:translation initiation factor IF-2 subunit beta [bacterium]